MLYGMIHVKDLQITKGIQGATSLVDLDFLGICSAMPVWDYAHEEAKLDIDGLSELIWVYWFFSWVSLGVFNLSRWWQFKDFLFSPRTLGIHDPI